MRLTDRELHACLDALSAQEAGDWDDSNYPTKAASKAAWKAAQSAITKLSREAARRGAARKARQSAMVEERQP